jgi:hypothetical protein
MFLNFSSPGTDPETGCRILPESRYIASAPIAQISLYYWNVFTKSLHSNGCIEISHVIPSQRIHWCAACCTATSNKHSYFYCCAHFNVVAESLRSNALAIHVTIVWRNRPMRGLLKRRNIETRLRNSSEQCFPIPSPRFPSPRFAPHHAFLGDAVTGGSRNSKDPLLTVARSTV